MGLSLFKEEKRGLGLRKFSRLNKALLCKWSWRFANERNALKRKVMSSKYGETSRGWHMHDIRGGFGVGLWKDIKRMASPPSKFCLLLRQG